MKLIGPPGTVLRRILFGKR